MKKIILLSITLVISLTLYWFFLADRGGNTSDNDLEERATSVDKNLLVDSHPKTPINQKPKEKVDEAIHSHSQNKESVTSNKANDTSWWFSSPVLESDTRFTQTHTAIELDPSCTSSHLLEPNESLEENFERVTQSSTQDRYQEDIFYFTLTQFWKLGDNFFQFVAIWDRDMPAVYRYEFYRSSDKSFNQDVEPNDLPIPLLKNKDVLSTNHYVAQLAAFYQQQGAQIGSRILESSINDPNGDQQVSLVNSQVIKWQTANFSCDSNTNFDKAYCYCNLGEKS